MLRKQAHDYFDAYWCNKKGITRGHAYKALARALNINPRYCHFSRLSDQQCQRAIDLCKDGSLATIIVLTKAPKCAMIRA